MFSVYLIIAAQAPVPGATAAPAVVPEKLVCRYLTATGTIFPGRICKTRAQWTKADTTQEREQQNRRESNTIDHSQGCTVGMPAC